MTGLSLLSLLQTDTNNTALGVLLFCKRDREEAGNRLSKEKWKNQGSLIGYEFSFQIPIFPGPFSG